MNYQFHNPHDTKMYAEAKAEDIRNPKNPLSRNSGPSLVLLLLFVVLIGGIYLYASQITSTYKTLDNALMNTNFKLVEKVDTDQSTLYTLLLKKNHYTITSEDFLLECTSRKIKQLYFNLFATNEAQTLSIYHDYQNETQKIEITHQGTSYDAIYLDLNEGDFLKTIVSTYTSSEMNTALYDQLFTEFSSTYDFGTEKTLTKEVDIDQDTLQKCTLGFTSEEATVKLSITFELSKK